jgi:CRISPR-associated protein Cmr5
MKTRAQQDLGLAARLVGEVAARYGEGSAERQVYGGLCHRFPVLVRTCGLCQALAFLADKAATEGEEKPRHRAHRLLLEHTRQVLEVDDALAAAQQGGILEYMLHTRRVLSAWVYFKRFAVSILKVESARAEEEAGDAG